MCRLSWPCLIVVLSILASLSSAAAAASAINSPRLIRKTRDVVTADKATPTPNVQRVRNTTYPACDQPDGSLIKNDFSGKAIAFTKDGLVPIYKSSDPVFYLTAEAGACGFNYTDQDHGVCLHNGWVGSAYHDGCNKWVEVTLPSLGTRTVARVIEGCHGETFGCDDIYLTLSTFLDLVGGNQTYVDDGRLPGDVSWRFVREPCFACEGGMPGTLPHGGSDDCNGVDSWGISRNGRKHGDERKVGEEAGRACEGVSVSHEGFDIERFNTAAVQHGFAISVKADEHEYEKTDAKDQEAALEAYAAKAAAAAAKKKAATTKTMPTNENSKGKVNFLDPQHHGSYALKVEDQKNAQKKKQAAANEGFE